MISILYSNLESFQVLWLQLGLSIILKFHLLVSHLPNFLLRMKGFSDITENRIEKYYQKKEKDRIRISRIAYSKKSKNSIAKSQLI